MVKLAAGWLGGCAFLLTGGGVWAQTATTNAEPEPGQKIAYYCDTIGQLGWERPGGFPQLVQEAFFDQTNPVLRAGAGAGTSSDLLSRLPKEILSQNPAWLIIMCGGNDVLRNIPLDKFRSNLSSILDQTVAAGEHVVVLSAPMLGEDEASPNNQKLAAYNTALGQLAQEKKVPFGDVNAAMQAEITRVRAELKLPKPGNLLTTDGTHLNGLGEEIVATEIVKTFGFQGARLAESRDLWLDQLSGMDIAPRSALSVRQYLQLRGLAASEGMSVDEMLNQALARDVRDLLLRSSHSSATKKAEKKDPPSPR